MRDFNIPESRYTEHGRRNYMPINASLKTVNVNFINDFTSIPPKVIDTSQFNQNAYNDINIRGHFLTDLNLIHCASIHYQSRFRNDISRRFRYTLDTIEPSLQDRRTNFYFDNSEEGELQKNSSEVIGVGFAVSLFKKLLDINYNCFNRIIPDGNGKRCDFEIFKNGNTFIMESKGRKSGLNKAKNEIYNQKANRTGCSAKYGCISMIKRDDTPVSLTVVDPPENSNSKGEYDRILDLLIYYTKAIQMCGFYNLANHLNNRIANIATNRQMITSYNNSRIEYQNVTKAGREAEFINRSIRFKTFITNNLEVGLNKTIKFEGIEYLLFFGIDSELLDIIEKQDYDALLKYNYAKHVEQSNDFINPNVSIHDDGTFLTIMPKNEVLV